MLDTPVLDRIVIIQDRRTRKHLGAGATDDYFIRNKPKQGFGVRATFFKPFKPSNAVAIDRSMSAYRPAILSKTSRDRFGLYRFELNGTKHYILRTASGLWLKHMRIIKSGYNRRDYSGFAFQRGWRDAAVFRLERLKFTFTHENSPSVPPGDNISQQISPEEEAFCKVQYADMAGEELSEIRLLSFDGGAQDKPGLGELSLDKIYGKIGEDKKRPVAPYEYDFTKKPVFPLLTPQPASSQPAPIDKATLDTLDKDQRRKWDSFLADVQRNAIVEFPAVLRDRHWDRLNEQQEQAMQDIQRKLFKQGLSPGLADAIDVSNLRRFHVSRAVLDLGDKATLDHHYIARIYDHYLDILDDQKTFIQRLRDFLQVSFSAHDSTLDEIMQQLNIIDSNVDAEDLEVLPAVLSYVSAIGSVPGAAIPQIGAVVSILNLGLQIVSDLRNDPAQETDLSNAGLIGRATDIKSKIRDDFLALNQALDQARKVLSSDVGALEIWRDANPEFVTDTAYLQTLVDHAFRTYCWAQLLPVGCHIVEEKVGGLQLHSPSSDEPQIWVENYVKSCREQERSVLGARYYYDVIYYKNSQWYKRWQGVRYRIAPRSGGTLLNQTISELMVDQDFTPERLMESAGLPSTAVDLHSLLDNSVFTGSRVHYCDRLHDEQTSVVNRLGLN